MNDPISICLIYLALGGCAFLSQRLRHDRRVLQAAVRSAWVGGCSFVVLEAVRLAWAGEARWVHLPLGLPFAAWVAFRVWLEAQPRAAEQLDSRLLLSGRVGVGLLRAAWWVGGALLLFAQVGSSALQGEALLLAQRALTGAFALTVGILLARAMQRRSQLAFRLTLYWGSFLLTFAGLLPRALAEWGTAPIAVPSPWRVFAAAALFAPSAWLARSATAAFARCGGTPEPLDPPARLCTEGPYSRLRHPLQLAELGMISAGALLWGGALNAIYTAGVAVALTVFLRRHEERKLLARFGESAREYMRLVPAFGLRLPHFARPRDVALHR